MSCKIVSDRFWQSDRYRFLCKNIILQYRYRDVRSNPRQSKILLSFPSPELSMCSWSVDRSSGGMNGFLALLGEASGELLFSVWFVSSRKATRGFGTGSLSLLGFVSVSVEVSNSCEALSFLDCVSSSISSLSSNELLRDRLLGDRRFLGPAGLLNWS